MPHLNKTFVDSVRPGLSGKDVTHFDDSLRGFGLRVRLAAPRPGSSCTATAMGVCAS